MSYYLETRCKNIDGKTKYGHFELLDSGNLIRKYNKEESIAIIKKMKSKNIEPKQNRYSDSATIYDQRFIDSVINLKIVPRKKKKSSKKYIAIASLALIMSIGTISNKDLSVSIQVVEDMYEDDEENIPELNNMTYEEKSTSTDAYPADEINNSLVFNQEPINNEFDNIFQFSYEDRSDSENVSTILNNYENDIVRECSNYGIDCQLFNSLASQENPNNQKNYDIYAGHGIFQVEGIWNGYEVYAYNFNTNQMESSGPIDVLRCTDDQEYCTRIAAMIFSNYYNTINTNYSYKLNDSEVLGATIFAYNKGITSILEGLDNTNTYDEFINYVKQNGPGGDNEYIEHVLSYVKDETIITMKTNDGVEHRIMIDNTNIDTPIDDDKKPIAL